VGVLSLWAAAARLWVKELESNSQEDGDEQAARKIEKKSPR
jgi:hypothetical protein